jgi:hypothetical protein
MKNRLCLFLLPLLISPVFSQTKSASPEEKALCGEFPKDEKEEVSRREEGEHLSKILPPVSSQNPASWCYAFASAPLIEHHRFLKAMKDKGVDKLTKPEQEKFAKEFYSDLANRLSPFEAVYSSNTQLSLLHPDAKEVQALDREEINLEKGGKVLDVFWGLQERGYRARSAKQVRFVSIDDQDSEARSVMTSLIDRYKKNNEKTSQDSSSYYEVMGCRIDEDTFHSSEFRELLRGLGLINQKLEKIAQDKNVKASGTLVRSYGDLASLLNNGEAPDFEVPPFTSSTLETDDKMEFLESVRVNLSESRPLSMSLCAFDKEFSSLASAYENTGDECGSHAVNIVGAYYREGKCVVKLRNTWGIDWPEKGAGGHKEVSLQDFLKLQENLSINRPGNSAWRKMKYGIQWIEAPLKEAPKVYSKIKNPIGIFEGEGSLRLIGAQTLRPYLKNGTLQHPSGDRMIYEGGKVVRFNRLGKWYKLGPDGKFYP